MLRPRYRTIVKNKRFEKELEALKLDTKGADDFIEGTEWVLSRNPEYGVRLSPDMNIWVVTVSDISSLPPLKLYYAFNNDYVWFLSIKRE